MPKAIIKSKSGGVITVQGTESEVANILSLFEELPRVSFKQERAEKSVTSKQKDKKRTGASDIIVNLKEHGFFNKPKSLAEIESALEEKGYLYPVTTLSGVMLSLVKRKLFGRKKIEGRWVYGK